ncbi:hypothetical protein EKO27_g6702 [Xylaria grammica]|uniref:RING-type domain-containing protein n=1 Tax=Xylaria grammica TaxID=363999 RepID=A0A439D1S7_9PEZI|nr:hypothetical protein EKO27_g6702 [Xylaria grammica]
MQNHPVAHSFRRSRRAPTQSATALDWPQPESDAIRQWRGLTTAQPQTIRSLGRQPRSSDSLRSDASLSGSEEDATSSSKKPRDATAHLKYLIRGYLKQSRSTQFVNDDGKKELTNKEYFIPSPKVTFLIDDPRNLICQICQHTPLKLARTVEDAGPEATAILPCGHICCLGCIEFWLSTHASCPFCRIVMSHAGCGHQVQPRVVAHDTIHTLPETLANGGKIGVLCSKCTERERREASIRRLTELAGAFRAARREAEILGTDEAIKCMRKAQQAFERIPENDYWVLSSTRHHQW